MRTVSERPAFNVWQRGRQRAKGSYHFRPYGFDANVCQFGATAFDLSLGCLSWLVSEGESLPAKHGPWDSLNPVGQRYFASYTDERPQNNIELYAEHTLGFCGMTTTWTYGDWPESPNPFAQIEAFVRQSTAGAHAKVIVAIVGEDVSAAKARAEFGKALTNARKGRSEPAKAASRCRRLLRGLNCWRAAEAQKRAGKRISIAGALVKELQAVAKLTASGLGTFKELTAEALKEIERLERALKSVTRL